MSEQIRRRKKASHPRNPWEKDRLVKELELLGQYGLRNKNELWIADAMAKKDKKQSSSLLILTDKKEFMTQGRVLLDRLYRYGIISSVDFNSEDSIRECLKEVLSFGVTHYLDRRLQTLVMKSGLASNVHDARNLITGKHITMQGRVVDTPSMMVRRENDGYIQLNPRSTMHSQTRKGRYRKGLTKNEDEVMVDA